MKGCICTILLLMCGMIYSAYSATQVEGRCLFGSQYLDVGFHTARPCMRLICEANGQISFEGCPNLICNPGMDVVGYKPERDGPPFPSCCSQPICKSPSKNN